MGSGLSAIGGGRNIVDRNGNPQNASVFDMCAAFYRDSFAGSFELFSLTNFYPMLENYKTLFVVDQFIPNSGNGDGRINYYLSSSDIEILEYGDLATISSQYLEQSLLTSIQDNLDLYKMSCTVLMTSEKVLEFRFSATSDETSRCIFISSNNTYSTSFPHVFTGIQIGGSNVDSNIVGQNLIDFHATNGLVSISGTSAGTYTAFFPVKTVTYQVPQQLSTKLNVHDEYGLYSYSFNTIIPQNAAAYDACFLASPAFVNGLFFPTSDEESILNFNNPSIFLPQPFDTYVLELSGTSSSVGTTQNTTQNTSAKLDIIILSVLSFLFGVFNNNAAIILVSFLFFILGITLETTSTVTQNNTACGSVPDAMQSEVWTSDGYLNLRDSLYDFGGDQTSSRHMLSKFRSPEVRQHLGSVSTLLKQRRL